MIETLLAAAAPSIIDLFTGGSKKENAALESQRKLIREMMARIDRDMGKSVTDSASYKADQTIQDERYSKLYQKNQGTAAAAGLTNEAKLGVDEGLNTTYNNIMLGAFKNAEEKRNELQRQKDNLALGESQMEVEQTAGKKKNQNNLMSSLMPFLPDAFKGIYDSIFGGGTPATADLN